MFRSLKFFLSWFQPTKAALFKTSIPWDLRWRLLLGLQPIVLLTYSMKYLPYIFSKRCSVIDIPTRGRHTVRGIVFRPSHRHGTQPVPLHINFHAGAFIGGIAEDTAPFCEILSDRAGAVVIGAEYRVAPAHGYPCAHEDAEDVVDWVLKNAQSLWNADPESLTVSGFSAGGNLMFAAGRRAKAAVGFYAPIDLRLPPWEKPKPETFPKRDPLAFMLPLYDAYAGPVRRQTTQDSTLNPILKDLTELPENVLLVVPGIDILVHEQLTFIERLQRESSADGPGEQRRFEAIVFEKGFHGWLELPSGLIDENERTRAYDVAIDFIVKAYKTS